MNKPKVEINLPHLDNIDEYFLANSAIEDLHAAKSAHNTSIFTIGPKAAAESKICGRF